MEVAPHNDACNLNGKSLILHFPIPATHDHALRNLVLFVQSRKSEKHSWRTATETLLKVTLLHCCFSHSLDCTNGTKLRKALHLETRNMSEKS